MLLAAALAAAQEPSASAPSSTLPPPPAHYFNDYAGIVPSAEARRLEAKLKRFDDETSTQVVVAIFPQLPSDSSLEDFTQRTAEAWKVGRKEKDNGAVFFVFVNDHKMRIEVGYGLEGALPDVTAKRILDDTVAPSFREGRYATGLDAGVDAIMAATRGEYTAPPPSGAPDSGPLPLLLPLGFIAVIFILSRFMDRPLGPIARQRRRRRGFWYIGPGGFGGGGGWGGGGFGGGGGGGFGGGGGSFGGGGASGSW